jgi:hypothetical protein
VEDLAVLEHIDTARVKRRGILELDYGKDQCDGVSKSKCICM